MVEVKYMDRDENLFVTNQYITLLAHLRPISSVQIDSSCISIPLVFPHSPSPDTTITTLLSTPEIAPRQEDFNWQIVKLSITKASTMDLPSFNAIIFPLYKKKKKKREKKEKKKLLTFPTLSNETYK